MKTYLSFVGFFDVPQNIHVLYEQHPLQTDKVFEGVDSHGVERYREVSVGFREGLTYKEIDSQDSLTVYLAKVSNAIGHLVASCPAGGWVGESFVFLDEVGNPIKSSENFNPNPVKQLLD